LSAPLLIEIGCEEIPARMIGPAARDLAGLVVAALDRAGLPHGAPTHWGGPRRLAVLVADVAARQVDREETVLGPAAAAAFDKDGKPTPAGAGFARKQGIDPAALVKLQTEKGAYAGFTREVTGKTLGEILAAALPQAVAGMSFPKSMRWGTGEHRWVRPVHAVVALHGTDLLDITLLGVRSGRASFGHRFLAPGEVPIARAEDYVGALRAAKVVVDPAERRETLEKALTGAAASADGSLVPDRALLEEVKDLVEWPGIVTGHFDRSFLELPREILVTTLRHHQKSFSVQDASGLLPRFLSVADTDRDPGGHVRRGNEWVVVGRLTDARFFWAEDRKRPLANRAADLSRVIFHKKLGSYADKVERIAKIADTVATWLGPDLFSPAVHAASLSKCDLVTGLVGEFPELQGIVGGLLLRAEGEDEVVARAVAEHYRPTSADDAIPESDEGAIVAVADRLDTIRGLLEAGEAPTGSRDPFGLRRAASGIFRILAERPLPLTMGFVHGLVGDPAYSFLQDRLDRWLEDRGYTPHEIGAVRRPNVSPTDFDGWTLREILSRLDVVKTLRGREDFARLVELTKRVDNILVKHAAPSGTEGSGFREAAPAALTLDRLHGDVLPGVLAASKASDFKRVVDLLAGLIPAVAKFFDDVLVLDPNDPGATRARCELLARVRTTVTRDFDIRELAGQAEARR
jgi:glycyl-tRNA synthetase beta chain